MSTLIADILHEADTWVGTPYRHQASCKGGGADCLGLIRGIWREIYGSEPSDVPPYSPDWSEPQRDEALWRAASEHLIAKDGTIPELGDVVLFRMRQAQVAKHLGVVRKVGSEAAFIHSYSGQGVVISPLSAPWARRIVARFQFPERTV